MVGSQRFQGWKLVFYCVILYFVSCFLHTLYAKFNHKLTVLDFPVLSFEFDKFIWSPKLTGMILRLFSCSVNRKTLIRWPRLSMSTPWRPYFVTKLSDRTKLVRNPSIRRFNAKTPFSPVCTFLVFNSLARKRWRPKYTSPHVHTAL